MRWTPGKRSANLEDRRGAGGRSGGARGGGGGRIGLGGLLLLVVLSVVFKKDFLSLANDPALTGGAATSVPAAPVRASAAEDSLVDFVSFVLDDAQGTWSRLFSADGGRYEPATLVLYRDVTPTACGTGDAATGPFYCPGDRKVYVDLGFFDALHTRFGAAGDFAQAYVLAHEIGHHVQTLTGTSSRGARPAAAEPVRGEHALGATGAAGRLLRRRVGALHGRAGAARGR